MAWTTVQNFNEVFLDPSFKKKVWNDGNHTTCLLNTHGQMYDEYFSYLKRLRDDSVVTNNLIQWKLCYLIYVIEKPIPGSEPFTSIFD